MSQPLKKSVPLRIQRFELKYLVPLALGRAILAHLRPFLEKDTFMHNEQTGYPVYSLYFDSPHLNYYQEKTAGLLRRKKIRIRTYHFPCTSATTFFLEIKRRIGLVIIKNRIPLPAAKLPLLASGHDLMENFSQSHHRVLEEFFYEKNYHGLSPHALIHYRRFAYVGKSAHRLRITLDTHIKGIPASSPEIFFHPHQLLWRELYASYAILEIKYINALPDLVHNILMAYEISPDSHSKYCRSIDQLFPWLDYTNII